MPESRTHHARGQGQGRRGSWHERSYRPRRLRQRSQQTYETTEFGEHFVEVCVRIGLIAAFIITESLRPFHRIIHPEELWMYRYPIPEVTFYETFGGPLLAFVFEPLIMIAYPFLMLAIAWYFFGIPLAEVRQAAYAFTMSVPLTGVLINLMKCFVGRPRPDFLARCYGMRHYLSYTDISGIECTTDEYYAEDGLKSFPSGHTGLAAACFCFLATYLCGQFGTFQERSKNKHTAFSVYLPLMFLPVLVGIGRTCDYKHHWQDVAIGGLIGYSVSYFCYRIYFPALGHEKSNLSYKALDEYFQGRKTVGTWVGSAQQVYKATKFYNTSDSERSRSESPFVDAVSPDEDAQEENENDSMQSAQQELDETEVFYRAHAQNTNNNNADF